jgi:hypothetical protein
VARGQVGVAVELHEFPAAHDGGCLMRDRNADFTTAFDAVFTATDAHIIRTRCVHRGRVTASELGHRC